LSSKQVCHYINTKPVPGIRIGYITATGAIYVDGADVLYNKFNITASDPTSAETNYECVVDSGSGDWRLSQCTDEHRVVCQSG